MDWGGGLGQPPPGQITEHKRELGAHTTTQSNGLGGGSGGQQTPPGNITKRNNDKQRIGLFVGGGWGGGEELMTR